MKTGLLRTYHTVATNTLEDLIYVAALNVEQAMLTGGAVPGKDYQMLDLYRLAMPLAMDLFEANKDVVTFVVGD